MGNDDTARDPFEELAAEFVERRRRGENPSVEEYAERYPELADEIRELFPTIGAIEGLQETELLPRGATPLGDLPFEALGDYRIVGELGRGGMGIVYEAEQVSLARHVAIKVLPRSHLLDAVHLERFRREAQLAARLHHTNIVPIFGVGEQGGYHYYVMQLIRGIGLDRAVARLAIRPGETLPSAGDLAALTRSDEDDGATEGHVAPTYWRWAARIGFCVADALAHAHGLGILHRDIKPANLLLDGHGDVWVADFGLAKAIQSDQATLTGGLTGTLRYMAPEQLRGQADARSDIYSLGITLYELLTLRPAFAQTDRSALMHEIAQGPPVAPRRVEPRVPRDLETIVLKATAREPRRRYGSARELAQDLERFLEGLPVHARRITVFERGWRWCTRNPAVASLTALAALLVVAVAVVASVGYARTRRALHAEARQRRRAEASADSAVTVLDAVFESFAPGSGGAPELTVQGASGDSVTLSAPPVLSRETAALLARLLSFYERLADQEGQGSALQRKVAEAHRRVADIRRRLGQRDEALAAYSRAIAITQALPVDAASREDRARSLAELHNGVGELHRTNHQPEQARQAHTRAFAILQASQAALSARSTYELARTHYLLGMEERTIAGRPVGASVGRRRGPMDDDGPFRDDRAFLPRRGERDATPVREAQHLEEAIALLEPLAAQRPADADCRRLLACCLREYSSVLHFSDGASAIAALDRATSILEALVDERPDSPDYRYELCMTYIRINPHAPAPPTWPAGAMEKRHLAAVRIAMALAAERPHVPQYALLAASIQHRTAAVFRGRPESERFHESAVDTCSRLVARFPHVPTYRAWHAAMQNALAQRLLVDDRRVEAARILDGAQATLKKLKTEHPELPFVDRLLEDTGELLDEALGIPPDLVPRR